MKKIISILLTIAACLTLCSCSCSKKDAEYQPKADFSRTAGVWLENGSPNYSRLIMDGTGAVESHYPENGGIEFTGYLGYDEAADEYAIFTDDAEFITTFRFNSDTVIQILGTDNLIYSKSDETLSAPELLSDIITDLTKDTEYDGYYRYTGTFNNTLVTNICFKSDISENEFIEAYIVRCIMDISGNDISNVTITENMEYTNKTGEHVYIVSWTSGGTDRTSFFFNTGTHTYMYTLCGSDADTANAVFDSLHLDE